MFGTKAKDLLAGLSRSEWLPPWDKKGVGAVLQEIQALYQEILDTLGTRTTDDLPDPVRVFLTVHKHALLHNKRCLLAYLKYRLDAIVQLRWETGTKIPQALETNLSLGERQAFTGYDRLLTRYMADFNLDLTADLQPPKELRVEVRALVDYGELQTEEGAVRLDRGTAHWLRRSDVVHLVRQGVLEQVDREGAD
ncbi:unnamed protein product [Phaeothamnion confervicola]